MSKAVAMNRTPARRYSMRPSHIVAIVCVACLLFPIGPALAEPVPVMLTFDTEYEPDKAVFESMGIDVPVTHFLLGQYAKQHPEFVREQSRSNSIGSHGLLHRKLTTLNKSELNNVFKESKSILESLVERPVTWFRAPNLEVDLNALQAMSAGGFVYNSSGLERWRETTDMLELPISTADGGDTPVSDVSLFLQLGMSDKQALNWLKERYREREPTGRPLVALLHPRIIGKHPDVLRGFIDFVKNRGGRFITVDQYADELKQHCPSRFGVWIDFILGKHDPAVVVSDLQSAGITDAFLMAKNTEGRRYFTYSDQDGKDRFGAYVKALKEKGIRVHAWLPINRDPTLVSQHPEWAMQNIAGPRSRAWLSPSHPGFMRHLLSTVETLVTRYDVDGLHLDYIRYPDISHDFSATTLKAFRKETGLHDASKQSLVAGDNYLTWMSWRYAQVTSQTRAMHDLVKKLKGSDFEMSAALIDEAAVSFRAADTFGQDYAQMAKYLDIISPMAYYTQDRTPVKSVARTIWATHYLVGNTTIMTGLPAWEFLGPANARVSLFERALEVARTGSDGYVFYPYLYLFGHGARAQNMPAGTVDVLKNHISGSREQMSCTGHGYD